MAAPGTRRYSAASVRSYGLAASAWRTNGKC
jgi:hypothetical protein